jgi:hypothetical protein
LKSYAIFPLLAACGFRLAAYGVMRRKTKTFQNLFIYLHLSLNQNVITIDIIGLSSNTLLHQTNHAGLSGIIRDKGFKVLYSLEEIKSPSPYSFKFAFPMISFSDIPFT